MQCSATSFRLNNANVAAFTMAKTGTLCSEDYITIEGISFSITKHAVSNEICSLWKSPN